MVFDKAVDGGCSRKRPDVRIECLTHSVIVECDENQHKHYSCEDKRVMQLFQDLGNRPLVVIRFNPDEYDDKSSCFKLTKAGYLSLNKKQWNERIGVLKHEIRKYTQNVPTKELTVANLFFTTL